MGQFQEALEKSLTLGVLNLGMTLKLVDEGVLRGVSKREIQNEMQKSDSSALDLRLSNTGWRLHGTFKPKSDQAHELVEHLVEKYAEAQLSNLPTGEVLIPGSVYLIKLQESLNLNEKLNLYAQASGKSSVGRLDVLTRLLIDNSSVYDEVPKNYKGSLYAEVIPLSFPIFVKQGYSVNQLRFFHGEPSDCLLQPKLLENFGGSTPIILDKNGVNKVKGIEKLSIDLSLVEIAQEKACAFVAKRDEEFEPIDLSKKDYDPRRYWNIVHPQSDSITMEKDSFYILRSKERFYLPNDITVRCIAYTENLGETRIHYAGFAHPWFARTGEGKTKGAPLIFEVRCHSFKVQARDGEEFARIEFYKMAEPTIVKNPDYDPQELKLSKCFREWQ